MINRRDTLVIGAAALASNPLQFARAAEPLRIGILLPLTGTFASDGARMLKSHRLAVKQINAAGGIKALGGAPIELVVADIQSKPEVTRSETERLINNEKVSALVGAWGSATTIVGVQVADRNKTPFLVTTAVADVITEQNLKHVFRIGLKAKWWGDYAADFMDYMKTQGRKIERVALCCEDGPAGQSAQKNYLSVIPARGFQIVANETFRTGSPDFSTIVTKLRGVNPDALLTVCYSDDTTVLLRAMAAQKFNPLYLGYGGAHVTQTVLSSGKPADRTFGVVEWNEDLNKPSSLDFVKSYAAEYPGEKPLSNQAQAYEAIYIVAEAAAAAKSTNRAAIRDALAGLKLKTGPGMVLPHEELAFDTEGQAKSPAVVVQAVDGKFVTVWPPAVAARKPA